MNIQIEEAEKKDFPLIINLLKELYSELGEEKESLEFLNEQLLENIWDSMLTEIFFAKSEDKVIGLLTLTQSQAIYAGGDYGMIDEMYVLSEFRSQNIGAMLVDKAKEIGRERGWKRIDVTAPTEERWKRTVAFYENCGFIFTGPKLKFIL